MFVLPLLQRKEKGYAYTFGPNLSKGRAAVSSSNDGCDSWCQQCALVTVVWQIWNILAGDNMISRFLCVRDSGASVGPFCFWVSPGVKWDNSSGVLSRGFFTSRLGEILWVSPYFGWAFPWNLQYGVFRATGLTSGLWSRVFFYRT